MRTRPPASARTPISCDFYCMRSVGGPRYAAAQSVAWIAVLLLAPGAAPLARAEEGKWTPQQVLQLDPQWLKRQGLELPVSRLWDPQRGTGLLSAAIALPGCSASFVSA